MSEFSSDWLQLREGADARARADRLLDALGKDKAAWPAIVDLGAGTGANLRHLVTKLGPGQQWCCLDRDAELLAQLLPRTAAWAQGAGYQVRERPGELGLAGDGWDAQVLTRRCDLAEVRALELVPAGALITASALLDLVSEAWLVGLIEHARAHGCALAFALSYDGRVRLSPGRAEDREVIALLNRHQRGDKGFGPALGPTAAEVAGRLAARAGYRTALAASDWRIAPNEPGLQGALLDGWLEAALALAPERSGALAVWRRARQRAIAAGELEIRVGHRDLVARPPRRNGPTSKGRWAG